MSNDLSDKTQEIRKKVIISESYASNALATLTVKRQAKLKASHLQSSLTRNNFPQLCEKTTKQNMTYKPRCEYVCSFMH